MKLTHFLKCCIKPAAVIAFVVLVSLSVQGHAEETGTKQVTEYPVLSQGVKDADGFEVVTENREAILSLNRITAEFKVTSKETGKIVFTKRMDGDSGNQTIKLRQKSDLEFTYFKDLTKGATETKTDYDMAIEPGQMDFYSIENGVRISYLLKEEKMSMDMFPKKVDKEKMENLVLQYLTKDQRKKIFDSNYRLYKDVYLRTKDNNVTQLAMQQLYSLFYEVGKYTVEDLESDNLQHEYESTFSPLDIRAVVEYTLDGGDLLVKIPMSECEIGSEEQLIQKLTVLPYLMSSDTTQEGYIFVPDGTGALIDFNNGRTTTTNYVKRVYGEDILLNALNYSSPTEHVMMPVIGMKFEDSAILGIVEDGAALAQINAEISGKSDSYNKVYFSFIMSELEKVRATFTSNVTVNKITNDIYKEDIVVRYKFLPKEKADYGSMAKEYQSYLVEKGQLPEKKLDKDATLYLEVMGATNQVDRFLGIPYLKQHKLTSFTETQEMLARLQEYGIMNIAVQLEGWANKGLLHDQITKIKPESVLGGKTEFQKLLSYGDTQGIKIFPSLYLQGYYPAVSYNGKADLFEKSDARKMASRFLSGQNAQKAFVYDPLAVCFINNASMYLVSPNYLPNYVQKAVKNTKKLGIHNLASKDLGNTIIPDYNSKAGKNLEDAKDGLSTQINELNEQFSMLLSGANDYAWKAADYVADIPFTSSQYNVFNRDVPFLQMVLDGYVNYSTQAINQQPETPMEEIMLWCIEGKMNPKFLVMSEGEDALERTDITDVLSCNFSDWFDRIDSFYKEYNKFYQKVAEATMVSHQILSNHLRKIVYSNGVCVYVNYGSQPAIDGITTVEPYGYLVVEGGNTN